MSTLSATRGQAASAPVEVPVSLLGLRADRTDISFENLTPDLVRIDVRVTNEGSLPSPATEVYVESAPLGAFLGWQPLRALAVPALPPGQSTVISGTAWVSRPAAPLGNPRSVTPAQLQAAVAAPPAAEATPEPETAPAAPAAPKRRPRVLRSPPVVAADPLAVLGRGSVYWAGNIDVLMRNKPVERHLARALRIYPGKTNAAMFFVGDRHDGYRFGLTGLVGEWQAELLDMTRRPSLYPQGAPGVIQGQWLELRGRSVFYLLLRPPHGAERGEVQVHVTRQSDGMEAVVEFGLDSRAAGAGCYTV
jgi:hypothetical protein